VTDTPVRSANDHAARADRGEPTARGGFLVVYDGMFLGGAEVEITATLEDEAPSPARCR